jgi:LysR family glycine cleavage system transcriptional activator
MKSDLCRPYWSETLTNGPQKGLPMSRLPLNTLTAFRAVGELQNLRAAASTLHLTHSAVSYRSALSKSNWLRAHERRGRRGAEPAGEPCCAACRPRWLSSMMCGGGGGGERSTATWMTVLLPFAQRWLLPRMGRWRERHPDLALEIDASPQPSTCSAGRGPGRGRVRGPDRAGVRSMGRCR